MMSKTFLALAILTAPLLSACTEATIATPTGSIPISRSFTKAGFDWARSDAETIVLYKIRDRGGFVETCGVIYTNGTGVYRSLERQVLAAGFIRSAGVTVTQDINYFTKALPSTTNTVANCAVTGVAWTSAFEKSAPEFDSRTNNFVY